ncbi:MAG: glutamate racemase [Cyanobacteria bacterium REEB67]|nr:glutamate racemase [Cyanobacteria bacterium REEB67]
MNSLDRPASFSKRRIGLFDSGLGGLTVLRRLARTMPDGQYFYLGDTARLPYGNRSRAEIAAYVSEIIAFLQDYDLDTVVMACNTSAALARDVAQGMAQAGGFELLDLIAPTARYIASLQCRPASVGVMATRATVNSGAFSRALLEGGYGGDVKEVPCPELVPLIESGRLGEPDIESALNHCLSEYLLALAGASLIVLGCTHFAFVADRIEALIGGALQGYFPGTVDLIDPAAVLTKHLQSEDATVSSMSAVGVEDNFFVCRSEVALGASDFAFAGLIGEHFFAPDMVPFSQVAFAKHVLPVLPVPEVLIFTTGCAQDFAASAQRCLGPEAAALASALAGVRQVSVDLLKAKGDNIFGQIDAKNVGINVVQPTFALSAPYSG